MEKLSDERRFSLHGSRNGRRSGIDTNWVFIMLSWLAENSILHCSWGRIGAWNHMVGFMYEMQLQQPSIRKRMIHQRKDTL